jgi:lactate dehydrogenase-like 2-hydroxyacid dehydrogenase
MGSGGRPGLLAIAAVYPPALAEAETFCSVHRRWLLPDADAFIREHGADIRVLATTGLRGFTAKDLDGLPNVGHVACFGMGHGTFDPAAAAAHGITVSNTPDWTDEAVADVALGLMIGTMRRLCEADRFVRAGRWAEGPFPMSTDLRGKTVGLIGLGSIGRAVARRVEGFGMKIVWHGPSPKADASWTYFADLAAMASAADCLVVCCASTPATRRLVDARILSALGPQGFLVNVSRGAVVDQAALIEALASGTIAGAGLEVFEDEPHVPAELRAMEQVMLVPHIGSSTREIRAHRQATFIGNVKTFLGSEGRTLA